jgi:hypothetical protein
LSCRASSLGSIKELRCRVLLKELFPLNLKEVGAADFFVTATVLLLYSPCLMSFKDILLASLDGLLEQFFGLPGLSLLLIVLSASSHVLMLKGFEILLQTLDLIHIEHQVILLSRGQLLELSRVQEWHLLI